MVKVISFVLFMFGCGGAQIRYTSPYDKVKLARGGHLGRTDIATLVHLGDYGPAEFDTVGYMSEGVACYVPRGTEEIVRHTEYFLVTFDRPVGREEAVEAIRGQGMQPANFAELLFFGAAHAGWPDEVGESIVAFGAICRERDPDTRLLGYAVISRHESEYRSLQVVYEPDEYEWPTTAQFLVVRREDNPDS